MYHDFFGLKEQAFSIAVNPRYLYMSDQHREALAHLLYGIQIGGFVLLTGEVGTGKTTIIRCLLEQLPEKTDVAIILNPMASGPELLRTICEELGVRYIVDDWGIKDLTDGLHHFLLDNHSKGRKTVLLIDEAQLLEPKVLEQIRLLTNLETTTEKLLQIILVGQPELKTMLAQPSLRQLSQRITARFHLESLSLAETHAYIEHRLRVAGLSDRRNPFTDDIVKKIHRFSGGIPRLINVISERILLGAYGKNRAVADSEIFDQAAHEVSGNKLHSKLHSKPHALFEISAFPKRHVAVAGLLVVSLLWLALSWMLPTSEQMEPAASKANAAVDLSAPRVDPATTPSPKLPLDALPGSSLGSSIGSSLGGGAIERQEVKPQVFWVRDANIAHNGLLGYLELAVTDAANPCVTSSQQTYSCERLRDGTWNQLKDVNRPAVLTLVTADKKLAYVLLVGLGEEEALVVHEESELRVPWLDIAQQWNGEFVYAWHRPQGFDSPLSAGQRGPQVNWLAEQFAILDQQSAPLTRNVYNDKLKKRVELFQVSQKIEPDGIVGAQTLRRLNEVLGIDKLLQPVEGMPESAARLLETHMNESK